MPNLVVIWCHRSNLADLQTLQKSIWMSFISLFQNSAVITFVSAIAWASDINAVNFGDFATLQSLKDLPISPLIIKLCTYHNSLGHWSI